MIASGRRFLTGRVARRIFLLFVLSAFLPLAAMALLSLSQVRGVLLEQGGKRLAAQAKSYGMAVFERLLIARDIAVSAASRQGATDTRDSLAPHSFASLGIFGPGGEVAIVGHPALPALAPDALSRLGRGDAVVALRKDGATPAVILVVPLGLAGGRVVTGQVSPEFLWGSTDQVPAATDFCVFEEDSRVILHCTADSARQAVAAVGTASTESAFKSARWMLDGDPRRAVAWGQFMRAAWGTPDWSFLASQAESVQLLPESEFRAAFVPVVALALLLAVWFTIRQSRSILRPVDQLAARARAITRNDFHTRLDMRRDDEFGELAGAFDHMSERLGRQFSTLKALSEIDRLILTTPDAAEAIRAVLERMGQVLGADAASVVLFDNESADRARTFLSGADTAPAAGSEHHGIDPADRGFLVANPAGRWLAGDDWRPGFVAPLRARGLTTAYVQPIAWHGTVFGALALGYGTAPPAEGDERRRARELSDRLAVAVSSAWRDERLYMQAHYDALTGLPNRLLFRDRLDLEIVRCQREGGRLAVLFADLDNFKTVNDSFGHTAGDEVLRETARRIAACVRESDTVARLGGDEFIVLLTRIQRPQDASFIADNVARALSAEFDAAGNQAFLSSSIGIATFPGDGDTAEDILRNADTAMYRAKSSGRSAIVYFEDRMNAEVLERHRLDRDLRQALDRGDLKLHYQPLFDLATGTICSAEALLRWDHPERGMIAPARFIPVAEETGVIEQIGQLVVVEACRQAGEWHRAGLAIEHIAINVSPRQFRKPGLVDFVGNCVALAGIQPSMLELEITEGILMNRVQAADDVLAALARLGVSIALDDFGTGFSSMAYLTRYPVDAIKIDRVFVQGLGAGRDGEAIVAAIIAMSRALGKRVIAEGVETAEQLAILRRLGCERIQGYYFSAALPPEQFAELLRSRALIDPARAPSSRQGQG